MATVPIRSYYRVMLGKSSMHADACFAGGFLGTDFDVKESLAGKLPEDWRTFNKTWVPIFMAKHPNKSKISAGLSCGFLWTVSKGIKSGDVVLCPDGNGNYRVGVVNGDYYYAAGDILPHRRKVNWTTQIIPRSAMSAALQASTGSIGTVSDISKYRAELDTLLGGQSVLPALAAADATIEDPLAFAMEKHLEEFLVRNWSMTVLGKDWLIYEEDGEPVGQQYETDAGPIDILAVAKDNKRLLVVELNRGRATDVVVGQVLRYIGYVKEQIAEAGQSVEGAIIALEDDPKLRWALSAVPSIAFYRYQISFKLHKA
jgi:restriction system protein